MSGFIRPLDCSHLSLSLSLCLSHTHTHTHTHTNSFALAFSSLLAFSSITLSLSLSRLFSLTLGDTHSPSVPTFTHPHTTKQHTRTLEDMHTRARFLDVSISDKDYFSFPPLSFHFVIGTTHSLSQARTHTHGRTHTHTLTHSSWQTS